MENANKKAPIDVGMVNLTPDLGNVPKTAPKVAKKVPTKALPNPLSRYGHREGTMAAAIDEMLWKGIDEDTAIKELVGGFKKEEKSEEIRNKVVSDIYAFVFVNG